MAIFEWICRDCDVFWDRECSVGKAPKRTKCPKCKKLCDKYWENANTAISFKDDGCGNANGTGGAMDFHTIKQRYRKFAKDGYDKDSAHRWYHRQMEASKASANDDTYRYKPVYLRPDRLVETGEARKLSPKEQSEKLRRARKLTADTYDKAKIDPNHRTKQY